jgi:hypothetical protein
MAHIQFLGNQVAAILAQSTKIIFSLPPDAV